MAARNHRQQGISLLELMIVVAIVGIIGAVAYPSYLEQVRDTRRAECSAALAGLANAMERHYSVSGSYLNAANAGNTGTPAIFGGTCPTDGGDATYLLTIEAATASTYTIAAAPTGAQAGDKCGSLTMTNTGAKNVVNASAGTTWQDCWR